MNLSSMHEDFDYSVKLKAKDTGSAVLIRQDGAFYLLTAAHVCEGHEEGRPVFITSIDGSEHEINCLSRLISPSDNGGADVCVMKLPDDLAINISKDVKCASFEGSGYPCQIDGFPSVSRDKKIRIDTGCTIAKESEIGDELYVQLKERRTDGQTMDYVKAGFSGSGVFVDSNGEKYLIGMVYRVEDASNKFIGWKMQKINEILAGKGWKEISLIPIELRQQVIEQYNNLIKNTNAVLARINSTIIGEVQLPRTYFKEQIEKAIDSNNIVVITGEAGIGKSALAKDVLSNPKYKSVAIVGDDLDESKDTDILNHWRISDRLQDLYLSPIWGEGVKVLLIESAERMLNGNTDTAIAFIDALLKETPDLKVVFTIRKNSLDLFRIDLQGNGVVVKEDSVLEIGHLNDDELATLENSFPVVKPFIESDKTRDILRNPFYMNLACSIASTLDVDGLKSSEFKDKLCRHIVSGKKHNATFAAQRISALIDVARRTSENGMNLVKCEVNDVVDSLVKDDVLTGKPETGYLRPSHDILTDWGLYCHINDIYQSYLSKEISLKEFYYLMDKNIASRNVLKQYIETQISEEEPELNTFISESLSIDVDDSFLDDLFYAILISEKGSSFLASLKPVLLRNRCEQLKRLANSLSYMFRKVDWEIKEFLAKSGVIEEGSKNRNSGFIVPTGKGWYTFVTFLYENRDVFNVLKGELIPILLQCELVRITQDEAPNLKRYVFAILADDLNETLMDEAGYGKPNKEVIRLLFKWMDENPELVKSWVERTIETDSYKYDPVKEFLLLHEGLEALAFINQFPDIYKKLIRKEWLDENGIVDDYYPMIHQSSGVTTSYKCLFYSHPADAIIFLCELLNEDIKKQKRQQQNRVQEVVVTVDDKQVVLWGNDSMWREYRGRNYQSHVRESLLMTFEKWLMDSINNNLNKAPHALSKESLLAVFGIVYKKCINVCAWGVLASVATRFPAFVGLKAMPIYSCREFIMWDKTRTSVEMTGPFLSPLASNTVRKEIIESNKLPHRKQDLEGIILRLSVTEGFAEEFRALVKQFKDSAKTYLEKVSAGRMDITQYEIIGKTDDGFVLQGKPSDDIKEEAEQNATFQEQFNRILATGNLARQRYDESGAQDINEWRKSYQIHKGQNDFISSPGLIASLGVKKCWIDLSKEEQEWCRRVVLDETMAFATTGQFQINTEYTSDALLYLLDQNPEDRDVINAALFLINSIGDNDALFTRFENTFKSLIWRNHKEAAEKIIYHYLNTADVRRDDVDRFAHVCKLLPTDVEDADIEEMAQVYCNQYYARWAENENERYMHVSDIRIETFCAEYMMAMPIRRQKFIEAWLETSKKSTSTHRYRDESPINSVLSHFCYVATAVNRDEFWQLWEIVFEWYKTNKTTEALSVLMLNISMMRGDLLDNWEVMEGASEHIIKLLHILPSEGLPFLPRLICNTGFNSLMPECLRHIDIEMLQRSAREKNNFRRWQNAVEDLYDNAKIRDEIRRDRVLREAYIVILNGLISNGSAIAYMIRDYYI